MMRVLDPTAEETPTAALPAPGLSGLSGRTVGLLDNGKIRVDRFLDHVEDLLVRDHGVGGVVRRRKKNASAPVTEEMLADLVACDAVVSAVGD